jgi:hypothetical protein
LKYLAAFSLFLMFFSSDLSAQIAGDSTLQARRDSIRVVDSLKRIQKTRDSLLQITQMEIAKAADSIRKVVEARRRQIYVAFQRVVKDHPYFGINGPVLHETIEIRRPPDNDAFFYFIIGLVLYIALMRLFFYKYVSTMLTLFFRATLRQQQLREQLLQAPLPALLMNIFFVVSVATYCTLLATHYQLNVTDNFWTTWLYAVVVIAAIYIVKFIFLNVVGWIFGIGNVTDTYIFIVFLINKMIGIFLVPFIALLAFPTPQFIKIVILLSYILIASMLFYRFLISYRPVRNEIKLTRFHFFLYLCAFEIAPLLLIYKVLLAFVIRSS